MAHFYIKQPNGTYQDAVYMYMLPTYYFFPQEILCKASKDLNSINRNPHKLFKDRRSLDIIASDAFFQLVIDGMAYLCWPFIAKVFDLHPNMEVYSGYHPAWILAHATPLWQNGLTDKKIIPTLKELYTFHPDVDFNILPYEEVNALLGYVYPEVIDQSGFAGAIEAFKEYPCHEDFSEFYSNAKTDFYRHWYHSRSKRKTCSLEEYKDNYSADHDGAEWDLPDETIVLDKDVTGSVYAENFINSLADKDKEILKLRLKERTMEEIANELGYKTHSAIHKRLKKMGEAYKKYAGDLIGIDP